MTAPWPPPPPVQRVSRPPSLVAVVFAVVLAMACQVGALIALRGAVDMWAGRLLPAPPPVSAPPAVQPSADASPSGSASATPSPTPPEQSVGPVEVTDALKRGVVLISGRTSNDAVAGTGMVLTPEGHVLTNYHVVRSTSAITVTVASTGREYEATMIGRDATKDVALLKLDGARDLEVVTLDEQRVRVGDVVVAAGNANGQGFVTAHRGNVLDLSRSIHVRSASPNDPPQRLENLIETNALAWPGDSGGPMFDAEGEVLGMTTAGSGEEEAERQVYAVPILTALDVVQQIFRGDESGTVVIGPKAYLGVLVQADDNSRVVVVGVEPDTPAGRTGLQEGDTITSLNGRAVASRADLSDALDEIEPDSTVAIGWTTEGGDQRTGEITVMESPLN